MTQVKRFMVIGTDMEDLDDYAAVEEQQFDTLDDAQALCEHFNDFYNGCRYFVIDFIGDGHDGGN